MAAQALRLAPPGSAEARPPGDVAYAGVTLHPGCSAAAVLRPAGLVTLAPLPAAVDSAGADAVLKAIVAAVPGGRAHFVPDRAAVPAAVAATAKPGDLVLTMGAGDVTALGQPVLDALRARGGPAG